ncbi:hypothetical protein ACL2DZ_00285 (plasmid) [Sinorhizobium meliloti]
MAAHELCKVARAIAGGGMNFINFTISGASASAPQTWLTTTVLPGVTVALIGGIVLFLLNWGREYLTAYWKKESEAEVLAFSLVTQFDQLISECADVVDDPLHEDRETGCYESTTKTPEIIFADGTDWSVFPKDLQYKIRSIPNKIDVAGRNISNIGEYGEGPPYYGDAFEERRIRFAWIGLEACLINEILAKKYGVPSLDRGDWEPEERFKREIERVTKSREEAANWPEPDWLLPKVPIEELNDRRTKLAADLDIAIKARAAR